MKKKNIVKQNYEYNRIIKNNKPLKYKDYIIYKEETFDNNYKFGISVGKKLGNAVVRNKLKRQIKNIIDSKCYEKSFNCIIILRKGVIDKKFEEMKEDLITALILSDIIEEEKNDKK